jgi:hypothetical protein
MMLETLAYAVWYAILTCAMILGVLGGSIVGAKLVEEHTRFDPDLAFIGLMIFGVLVMGYYSFLTL